MGSLRRGGLQLGMGTVVSRALGFLRAAALAAVVGTVASQAGDAFAVANQLPNNVFWLVSSGVFSAVLVPQLVQSARGRDGGAAFLNKLLTAGLVIVAIVTVAALVVSPWLVSLYTREWAADQYWLAVTFALWCLPQIFFYGVFSLFGEALNARGRFAPAAWAPLANNLVSLAGLAGFAGVFGVFPDATGDLADWSPVMVAVIAGTATLGVASQALVVAIVMRRAGIRFRLDFRWRGVALGSATRVAGWTFGLVLIGQLLGVVQGQVASLASGQGASTFAGATAWLLFMLPYSVIAVSTGTVYFTRFSEHGAAGDTAALSSDIAHPLRVLVVVMTGAAVAMTAVALPISRFFTDTPQTAASLALVLVAYTVALVPFSLLFLFQRAFYALNDARTPFIYTCVQAGLLLAGTLAVPALVPIETLTASVALIQSIATTAQAVAAATLLRRKLTRLGGRALATSATRAIIATAITLVATVPTVLLLVGTHLDGWAMQSRGQGLAAAGMTGILASTLFIATMFVLRDPIPQQLYRDARAHRRK